MYDNNDFKITPSCRTIVDRIDDGFKELLQATVHGL